MKKATPKSNQKNQLSTERVESSDDDVPLTSPSDQKVKSDIKAFLSGKDLSTVTKGIIKEMLRKKYGDALVSTKRSVITEGIEEGMQ